ncbi:MAG: hypothetical protein MUC36_05590 [Planctomycetes bacterium]|jgi:hypothetical protein|nr:hypothetical protein [Planctomycetota bacterium]
MKACLAAVVVAVLVGSQAASAQEPEAQPGFEACAAVAERIRSGGWFEASKWRRGDDGALEMHYFADVGGSIPEGQDRFVPLLGQDLERGIRNGGAIGFVSMLCHGAGDLLGMTDAEFHFGALGIDATDVGLRQFLATPRPSFEGARGRAELLDRLLAIEVLVRRGVKGAVAELGTLASEPALPAALRERAGRGIAVLRGNADPLSRLRLSAETLQLPAAFDGCLMIDHARLPDLSWFTPFGRRLGALTTAKYIAMAGGTTSPEMRNGAQCLCDLVSELPFGVVHRHGNARLDHSCVVLSAKADAELPVALTWQAAGAFEAERWQDAKAAPELVENNPLLGGTLQINADRLFASTDGSAGKPRPSLVEKYQLLRDDGVAVRAVVPANSKLWPMLAFLTMPPAEGGELRIAFGDPAVITVRIEARDEDAADAWVTKGKELLALAKAMLEQEPGPLEASPELLKALTDAALAASFSTKDATAIATIEVKGMTPAKLKAIGEALAR